MPCSWLAVLAKLNVPRRCSSKALFTSNLKSASLYTICKDLSNNPRVLRYFTQEPQSSLQMSASINILQFSSTGFSGRPNFCVVRARLTCLFSFTAVRSRNCLFLASHMQHGCMKKLATRHCSCRDMPGFVLRAFKVWNV